MNTILASIDFSNVTAAVIATATDLARATRSKVVLVHVTEPVVSVLDYAIVAVSVARVNNANVQHSLARLATLKTEVEADGVECAVAHTVGTPAQEIIEQARTLQPAYVVMGSHGHTAFYDLIVGSTTGGVLKRARCPVVIVPASPGTRPRATAVAAEATSLAGTV